MEEAPITQYRDFWDYPRIFLVSYGQALFLFDCRFDEELEDFGTTYRVYAMPHLEEADTAGPWDELHEKATRFLGEVPVSEVSFDETRRKFIDAEAIRHLLESVSPPS